ncbi:hypothetical protein BC828DRAFT_391676 [Blastocladiella britannica]|nr:hypothetical protein BC828DRAFT_391676 [Blastocladiella britannica]
MDSAAAMPVTNNNVGAPDAAAVPAKRKRVRTRRPKSTAASAGGPSSSSSDATPAAAPVSSSAVPTVSVSITAAHHPTTATPSGSGYPHRGAFAASRAAAAAARGNGTGNGHGPGQGNGNGPRGGPTHARPPPPTIARRPPPPPHLLQQHQQQLQQRMAPLSTPKPRPERERQPPAATAALATLTDHPYPPLALSIATDLIRGTKECLVCFDHVRPKHQTWSCGACHAVLHMDCVKEWTQSHVDPAADASHMRCPACNSAQPIATARAYMCFCGKTFQPKLDRLTVPHACGSPCGKPLPCTNNNNNSNDENAVVHTCPLPCHPGPCAPCSATIARSCPGGHVHMSVVCGSDAAKVAVACAAPCNRLLHCGKHKCSRACHEGDCDQCQQPADLACRCGRSTRPVTCDAQATAPAWACESPCAVKFPCSHACDQICCSLAPADHIACPTDPSRLLACPCGKTPARRTSCRDPPPKPCGRTCGRVLSCGHTCPRSCHTGECECEVEIAVRCRCGADIKTLPCAAAAALTGFEGDSWICTTVCGASLQCRRSAHKCKTLCCPASKRALEGPPDSDVPATGTAGSASSSPHGGNRSRRGGGAWMSLGQVEARAAAAASRGVDAATRALLESAYHGCPAVCGRPLSCGNHTCQRNCHAGNCPPCLEASFDELVCPCGRSSIVPPVACGTTRVPCRFTCSRVRPCGHPTMSPHPCHPDSAECPPCVVLVAKPCACGKSSATTRCSARQAPACAAVCGAPLPCEHVCTRGCHDPVESPCKCTSACGKRRERSCGHVCKRACHNGVACEDAGKCEERVTRKCECSRRIITGRCIPGQNSLPLECDDACRIFLRNRNLADALGVVPKDPASAHTYTPETVNYALIHPKAARSLEETLAHLVAAVDTRPSMTETLPAMKAPQRKFVHEVAAAWQVQTVSLDPEPHRCVQLTAKRVTSRPPPVFLAEAVVYEAERALHGPSSGSSDDDQHEEGSAAAAATLQQQQLLRRKRAAAASAVQPAINALVVVGTALPARDLESYIRLYLGSTPFVISKYTSSSTDPTLHDAVVQVAPAAKMAPFAAQDVLREARSPMATLLVDLGKARAVKDAYVDRDGRIVEGGFSTAAVARAAAHAAAAAAAAALAAASAPPERMNFSDEDDDEDRSQDDGWATAAPAKGRAAAAAASATAKPSFASQNVFAQLSDNVKDKAWDDDAESSEDEEPSKDGKGESWAAALGRDQ